MRLAHDQETQIVGRDAEFSRVGEILERRAPALVVIAGDTGHGKTTFVHEVTRRARSNGWAVVQETVSGGFSVTPATTPDDFEALIRALLDLPPPPSGASLVEGLAGRAPVMLIIDGYRADQGFADWFLQSFLDQAHGTSKPIVTLVADRREELDQLVPRADMVLSFGPLAREPIREHLRQLGAGLVPPLGEEELEAYVGAAQKDVEALAALTRLLPLTSSAARAKEAR